MVEEAKEEDGEAREEEDGVEEVTAQQPHPKRHKGLSDLSDSELREEMKRRRYKGRGRSREEIILLLEEDSRTQRHITWVKGGKEEDKCNRTREV